MLDLRLKEAIVSNGIHSFFVKYMFNTWSTCHRIISYVRKDLVAAVLEHDPQLQWKIWRKDMARTNKN